MEWLEIPQPDQRDWRYRLFEILPGLLSWSILILPVILGIFAPKIGAYFVVSYLLLWFMRAIGMDVRAMQGWRQMNKYRNMPWQKLNQDLENLKVATAKSPDWHRRNIERVQNYIGERRLKPSEVYHAIFIAFWHEPREILEPTIQSVLASQYDPKKIILLLAYEERGGAEVKKTAHDLVKEYGKQFFYAEAVEHVLLDSELPGKGANITNAGRRLVKILKDKKIEPRQVIVTTLDSDNRPDPTYLPALTYTFCSTEEPKYASYQPIPMFLNNIWDAPAPMRVIATGNSFWNIILATRPHMLRNFSSHAQPMEALIDTDFWSVRTIVEDGHQYWRTFFRYDGNHDVFPIYAPIYQDAVLTESYRSTLRAQFVQIRRWAYGASDIAYFAKEGFFRKNKVPKGRLIARFWRLLEGHLSWATSPLILLLAAYPLLFLNPQSYLANQLPRVASQLQTIAMVGIFVSLFLSLRSLPPKPAKYRRHRTLWMVLQWVYLPFTTILYNSFAALNSQTRLMFGWYLGKFDSTAKAVKSERSEVTDLL